MPNGIQYIIIIFRYSNAEGIHQDALNKSRYQYNLPS